MGRRSIPHRPEALPLRATAHTSCRWYLLTITMLAYRTVDDWTTRSSSTEACRSTPAHSCRALGLTPKRCEAEVLLTVGIAVVVGGHGRVATAHQIAPWSRGSDLLSIGTPKSSTLRVALELLFCLLLLASIQNEVPRVIFFSHTIMGSLDLCPMYRSKTSSKTNYRGHFTAVTLPMRLDIGHALSRLPFGVIVVTSSRKHHRLHYSLFYCDYLDEKLQRAQAFGRQYHFPDFSGPAASRSPLDV